MNANTNGTIEVWKEKLNSFKFSDERIEELEALLAMVPKSKLPDGDSEKDSRNLYMMQKIAKLIRVENDKRVEGGRIRSRFFYLKSLLEKDIVNAVHWVYKTAVHGKVSGSKMHKKIMEILAK